MASADDIATLDNHTTKKQYSIETRLGHFTWAWYLSVVGTGGIAVQLHAVPFRFHGLETIGSIVFIMSIITFLVVTGLLCRRFLRWKHSFRNSILHPMEGLMSPTFLLACATILINTCNYGFPKVGSDSQNNWLASAIEICFWVYTVAAVIVAIMLPYVMYENINPSQLYIIPIVLTRTVYLAQSPHQYHPLFLVMFCLSVSPALSRDVLPIIITGLLLQGFGIITALMFIALFLNRLMIFRFPPPNMRPAMFIAAGPPGFTSVALLSLGRIGRVWFGNTEINGDSFFVSCLIASMLFWGIAGWWILLASTSIIAGAVSSRSNKTKSDFEFHLNWWAFIFPNTGFITATLLMGTVFNSKGVHIFGTVLVLLQVLIWLFLLVMTPRAVYMGTILVPGKDEDMPIDEFTPAKEEKRL